MYNGSIPTADINLPKPQVHARHPLRNDDTHNKLLDYLKPRLAQGKAERDARIGRMASIDKSVAGWMKLDPEDKKRQAKQDSTGTPQALTVNLPLNFVQLDDMMTYFAQTFAPNRGMFYQQGKPEESGVAQTIVTLMNNHAIYAGYYPHILRTIFSILKYNQGGFTFNWSTDTGPRLSKDAQNQDVLTTAKLWEGNRVESLDMYNTFHDPSVSPTEVYREGEWCATTALKSHFWLQKRAAEGLYFNCEDLLKANAGVGSATYYRHPPAEAMMRKSDSTGVDNSTDWVAWMSEASGYSTNNGFEITTIYVKLNPVEHNLIPVTKGNQSRNQYEIWRITLCNGERIIDATHMNNMHGFLPMVIGMLHDDAMSTSQKSVAEIIQPLQDFASFLLNTHVRATRRNIWGLTIYDSNVVDLSQIPEGEVSARIAAKPLGTGRNISDAIWERSGTLDTKQTMQDLESVMAIIGQFFPTTSMPSQIAGIDRAIDSQVAAVQQGANRRMQKGARLLDEMLFRPLRFALYYNILQFQKDGESVSDFYGKPIRVDLQELRSTDLPFIIGQGLKAIDRQAAAGQLQTIIFAMIQNPLTAQQVDLMKMIDYWTSMLDIDIDMTQFAAQPPAPAGIGDNGPPPGPLPGDEAPPVAAPEPVV
jgi:hypothetical protein